jgi:undecaprenyl-diphosphatase
MQTAAIIVAGGVLNDYLLSVLLGIVEGLTEFLPVSSTAHLRICEKLMHISLDDPYWKMYSIVIQLGAILALLLLFLPRIVNFFRSFPEGERGKCTFWTHPITLTMVAFVCTSIPSLLMIKRIGKNLESLKVIALALIIGGIIMWIVDNMSEGREPSTTNLEEMSLGQAVWIGLCQVFSAVIPGTSRSMSTIAAGQIVGMDRPAALEFSFLLSIPTMIAATGYSLVKALHPSLAAGDTLTPLAMTAHLWIVLAIGFVVSFFVALIVVEWFLVWVREHGFVPFAVYRIIVGSWVLYMALHR